MHESLPEVFTPANSPNSGDWGDCQLRRLRLRTPHHGHSSRRSLRPNRVRLLPTPTLEPPKLTTSTQSRPRRLLPRRAPRAPRQNRLLNLPPRRHHNRAPRPSGQARRNHRPSIRLRDPAALPLLLPQRHHLRRHHDISRSSYARPQKPPRLPIHLLDRRVSLDHGGQGLRYRLQAHVRGEQPIHASVDIRIYDRGGGVHLNADELLQQSALAVLNEYR